MVNSLLHMKLGIGHLSLKWDAWLFLAASVSVFVCARLLVIAVNDAFCLININQTESGWQSMAHSNNRAGRRKQQWYFAGVFVVNFFQFPCVPEKKNATSIKQETHFRV